MKKNTLFAYMRRAGGIFLLAAVCAGSFSSCNDDNKTPNSKLDKAEAEMLDQSVSSLAFNWKAIKNASQYGYELRDPDGNLVENGVTTELAASFTELKPNTTYTLKVWAYGAYGSGYETSEPIYLTATTPAVMPLGQPEVSVSTSGATTTVTWNGVDHAKKYSYYLKYTASADTLEQDIITDSEIAFFGLDGEYEVGVKSVASSEAYSDSEYAKNTFSVEKVETWRVQGTYDNGQGYTWKATLVAYSNSTYKLLKWYGNEGYDLEFAVKSDGKIAVTNHYQESSGWYYVRTDASHRVLIYPSYQSSFSGDETSGTVKFYTGSSVFESFTWPVAVTELWRATGKCSLSGSKWNGTLAAYSDGSYKLLSWYGVEGYDLQFSVGSDGKPSILNSSRENSGWYYVKCNASSELGLYPSYNSAFSGNQTAGTLSLWTTFSSKFEFTWGAKTVSSIDDLVGTYSGVSKGYERMSTTSWTQFNYTENVTVTKQDATTLVFSGLFSNFSYCNGKTVKGTVDTANKTITFAPQDLGSMRFCKYADTNTSIVATYTDEGVISFSNFTFIYNSYSYVYDGATMTLTPQ